MQIVRTEIASLLSRCWARRAYRVCRSGRPVPVPLSFSSSFTARNP